jgi:hypothetical protein
LPYEDQTPLQAAVGVVQKVLKKREKSQIMHILDQIKSILAFQNAISIE